MNSNKRTSIQSIIEKTAFFAPFEIADKKEYNSFGGYMKEYGNRGIGGLVGLGGGLAVGAGVGMALTPKKVPVTAAIGGLVGMVLGDHRSLMKTERNIEGVKPTTGLGYLSRSIGGYIGSTVVPLVGGPFIDYHISRRMQER